jgi:hypothetical protein
MQNPRTTISALVGIAGWLAAHYGFHVPADIQNMIVLATLGFIGYHAQDGRRTASATNPPSNLKAALALLLAPVLLAGTFTMTACGASEVQRIVAKSSFVVNVVNSLDPASQLLAEKLIDEAEAALVRTSLGDFSGVYSTFNDKLTALVKANPQASLIEAAPLFIDALVRFNSIHAIHFKNSQAQLRLEQILGVAKIALAVIAAFFASHMSQARDLLSHPHNQLWERAKFAVAGVSYDREKLLKARTLAVRSADGANRAVCFYLELTYDRQAIEILESYAQSAA